MNIHRKCLSVVCVVFHGTQHVCWFADTVKAWRGSAVEVAGSVAGRSAVTQRP